MGNIERIYTNGHDKSEHEPIPGLRVMKFGGTSVGGAEPIRKVTEIIRHERDRGGPIVAVVSAMSGVTNRLVEISSYIEEGELSKRHKVFEDVLELHQRTITELTFSPQSTHELRASLRDLLSNFYSDVHSLEPLSPERRDRILSYGERLSARIVAANLRENGIKAYSLDSPDFLKTNEQFGEAQPDLSVTRQKAKSSVLPLVKAGYVPVVTGFLGSTHDNKITTLGRGGSDYSASLIGKSLDASQVWIWTDVDGVYTADPNKDPNAQVISELSMIEADRMAKDGAKVLHSRTLEPLMGTPISLLVKNTFNPISPGTLVRHED